MFMGDMPELMEIILNDLNNELYSLYSCALVDRHWFNLLFKLFVESGATLHKLGLYFSDYEINPEIFYSLGRNEQFFSRLQDLSLGGISEFNIESVNALLEILAKNTTKINALKLEHYSNYEPRTLHALEYIIKSQEQLRQFSLSGIFEYLTKFHGIISALDCQNKSLYEVIIESCTCDTEFKVLMNCKNLGILRIHDCNVEFSTQFLVLIGNLQKLQFLTLWDIYEILGDEPKIQIMQFAKLLPLTLQYLDLRNSCLSSYIDILFNNCNASLKYLLIDRHDDEKGSKALIEFCIRKKNFELCGCTFEFG
ncbi:hypothetical protein F8M41_018181 [Gigaspora margarita]|uniref:Uncharacterized protein n=1 Tax=Gigaspora margarita TaxID=4874 RepID=A0A8H4ALY3_GIGMA|nr:hypothetical protein F8M41_018181 [Gigaspora margarita]